MMLSYSLHCDFGSLNLALEETSTLNEYKIDRDAGAYKRSISKSYHPGRIEFSETDEKPLTISIWSLVHQQCNMTTRKPHARSLNCNVFRLLSMMSPIAGVPVPASRKRGWKWSCMKSSCISEK